MDSEKICCEVLFVFNGITDDYFHSMNLSEKVVSSFVEIFVKDKKIIYYYYRQDTDQVP